MCERIWITNTVFFVHIRKCREKFKSEEYIFKVSENKRNVGSDDVIESDFLASCMKVFSEYLIVLTVIAHRKEINGYGEI